LLWLVSSRLLVSSTPQLVSPRRRLVSSRLLVSRPPQLVSSRLLRR
jgi:hypothetical protein